MVHIMDAYVPSKSPEGLLTLQNLRIRPGIERLASHYGYLGQIRDALRTGECRGLSNAPLNTVHDQNAWETAHSLALAILEQAALNSVRVLGCFDEDYPVSLRRLGDKPPVLYIKGEIPSGAKLVACIGTTAPSTEGAEITREIVRTLVHNGWSIVSGLARGIDVHALAEAVANHGWCAAVLGNGLDPRSIYPKENLALAERIAQSGALISEQPCGTRSSPKRLVARDRLQSGLSVGVILMESDYLPGSGSMHTIRFAVRQNRLLFAALPEGAFRGRPGARANLALAQLTGPDFAAQIGAKGKYRALLRRRFPESPVAVPLSSSQDYQDLVESLERAIIATDRADHADDDLQLKLW